MRSQSAYIRQVLRLDWVLTDRQTDRQKWKQYIYQFLFTWRI